MLRVEHAHACKDTSLYFRISPWKYNKWICVYIRSCKKKKKREGIRKIYGNKTEEKKKKLFSTSSIFSRQPKPIIPNYERLKKLNATVIVLRGRQKNILQQFS